MHRGIPHELQFRLRLVCEPAVGYVETDSVTLLMAFPFEEGAESEHCTMATEALTQAMDPEQLDRLHEAINSGEAVISVPTPSTVQLSLEHSLLAHLNPRMIRIGEYYLDLEDETQPRGLYVLEPGKKSDDMARSSRAMAETPDPIRPAVAQMTQGGSYPFRWPVLEIAHW